MFARKFHITGLVRDAPKLSLPGKLVFPSVHNTGHFSMLGLGDIVRTTVVVFKIALIYSYIQMMLIHKIKCEFETLQFC